jgi:hypothetical protein
MKGGRGRRKYKRGKERWKGRKRKKLGKNRDKIKVTRGRFLLLLVTPQILRPDTSPFDEPHDND